MGAWAHRSTSPVGGAASFLREQVALFSDGTLFRHPGAIAPLAHFTLFAVLAAVQIRKRRFSDAAWTAGVLGLAFLTGTTNGVPRYTATIFPGHILLFELLEHRPGLRDGGARAVGGAAPPARRPLRELALRLVRGRVCFRP